MNKRTTDDHLREFMAEFFGSEVTGKETLGDIQELAKQLETLQQAKEILNEQ